MQKSRILIVEDESIVALEIENMILKMSYEVCGIVESGAGAIVMAGEQNPDLILMDINLQGEMDGVEAAGQIRQQLDIPVVFLTAYSDEKTVERAKYTQPLGYVQKPFQPNDLRITLELALYTARIDVERKLALKDLVSSENQYRDLFNRMVDGFAVHEMLFDAEGAPCDYRFLSVNPSFERYTGLKAADVCGKTVLEVIPGIEKIWIETYGEVVLSGNPVQFNNYAEGMDKYFEVSAYHIQQNQFACTFVDRTERYKAEEKLARESELNSILAEISTQLISPSKNLELFSELILEHSQALTRSGLGFVTSVDLQSGSDMVIALSSRSDENAERESRRDSDLMFKTEDAALMSRAITSINPQPHYDNQTDGSSAEDYMPVSSYLSVPVLMQNKLAGQIVLANGTVGYSDDDLRAVEQIGELYVLAIQRQRNETEKKMMQEQMLQMQKMEAIGTLAGGIAHDFNNILQPIMGYANMALKNVTESEKNHKYLSSILVASQRAKELVQQILTFARKNDLELQPIEIQLIVKEAIKLLRSSLPATIEIQLQISKNCGIVMADPIRIHQIVMNLTTNAFHAMQERGGVMVVNLTAVDLNLEDSHNEKMMPGRYVCLTISDTGIGIEHEVLDKIFDPYFTTRGQQSGTGLGLSVVAGIVSSYGGKIKVSSSPGRGSEFNVFLPQIANMEITPEKESTLAVISGNERILVVDDEPVIVELEKGMLQQLGYQVTERVSSMEALELFKSHPDDFDLVVTDMTMPTMTGTELARQIFSIKPDLPVILCTGFSELINAEKAKTMGIKKLMMKPISQNQLGRAIREVLDGI